MSPPAMERSTHRFAGWLDVGGEAINKKERWTIDASMIDDQNDHGVGWAYARFKSATLGGHANVRDHIKQ